MLARRGPARAAQFSWRQGAESVHEVLQLHRLPGAADRGPRAIHPERRI
jgi:hypothetical protein